MDADNIVFETEDSASAFIRFENGAAMTVDVSWAINGKDTGIYSDIFGTKAGASLNPLVIYDEQENYLVDSTPASTRKTVLTTKSVTLSNASGKAKNLWLPKTAWKCRRCSTVSRFSKSWVKKYL